jgi:hypothetical protein
MALCGAGATAQTQPTGGDEAPGGARRMLLRARAPRHVIPRGESDAVLYATGERVRVQSEDRWRPICGSDVSKLTDEDLKRMAEEHERIVAQGNTVVVDTPRAGGFNPRANINLVFNISGTIPSGATAAFATAETYIESQFADPITVTVSVTFANLGGGVLGGTSSTFINNQAYSTVRTGLINGMDSTDTIQTLLPTPTLPVKYTSAGAVTNETVVDVTRANYNATIGVNNGTAATMQYNNAFSWDMDPTNGIVGSQVSLVDVIVHETIHALGFVSGADGPGFGGTVQTELMDLYRFRRSTRNPATNADFTAFERFITFNDPTTDDVVNDFLGAGEWRMSDGNPSQASHWFQQSFTPSTSIGIMQPALANGVTFFPDYIRTSDKTLLDAIGYDEVIGCSAAPTISAHPATQTVCVSNPVTFSVTATGGVPTYQWRKNSVDISGATNDTYTIASAGAASAGSYDCVVTNACGSTTSNAATLTVNTNAAFNSHPSSQTICTGSPVTFSVNGVGNPAPTLQWRKNGVNISGATSSSYTIPSVVPGDAGTYDCVGTNPCATATSNSAVLTVNQTATITGDPAAATRCVGTGVTFNVSATGAATLTYQWRKNASNISGATSTSYTIASVVTGDAGTYDCVVTNSCGSDTSAGALLTVNSTASISGQPSPASACVGSPAAFSVTASGATGFQWRKNGSNIGGATGSTYSIPSVSSGDAGSYDCLVSNSCGTVTSNAAALTVNTGPGITSHPSPLSVNAGDPASFSVSATGSPAPTFQWRLNGSNLSDGGTISGATASTLNISSTVAGDAGNYDVVLTNSCGTTTSNTAALTVSSGCVADFDDGSGTGTPDGGVTIDDLLYYLTLFEAGDVDADVDDGSGTNTPDGGVTIDDLLYFLVRFEAGC